MVLVACAKEETSIVKIEEVKNPYEVTPDEAVQLLQTVVGGESTRAVSVGSIQTLKKSDFVPTTRGAEDGDVVYIVDLEDGGSAIMGADKRMEPIYAILDETKISPEQLTLTATRSDDGEQDIEEYVMGLVNDKIQADASTFAFPEMPMIPRDHYWTETTTINYQAPLLQTKWHQQSPFNNSCPMNDAGTARCHAGCGPIAVAQIVYYNRQPQSLGGITFDWDLISEYEYGNSNHSTNATIEVANLVSQIGHLMNADYDNQADETGTSTTKESARALFLSAGYSNAAIVNYSLPAAITMVYHMQKPVFIRGNESDGSNGHAWVIDGCNVYEVDYWIRHYINEEIYNEYIEKTREYNLVHCNYGWAGYCDGYYTSGLFDTTSSLDQSKIDSTAGDISSSQPYNFNSNLYLITY